MKHSTIFKSRWMALVWAAGICWFAVDIASSSNSADPTNNEAAAQDGTDSTVSPNDLAALKDAVKQL